jgi:hypothetical protein
MSKIGKLNRPFKYNYKIDIMDNYNYQQNQQNSSNNIPYQQLPPQAPQGVYQPPPGYYQPLPPTNYVANPADQFVLPNPTAYSANGNNQYQNLQ